jgi:hypothetical protein
MYSAQGAEAAKEPKGAEGTKGDDQGPIDAEFKEKE